MGQLDNTLIVFTPTTAREHHLSRRRHHPLQGRQATTWEAACRAPMVARWPGHIKPGTVKNEMSRPRLVADASRHRRRTEGDRVKKQIEAGSNPGIVRPRSTRDQRAYLEGASEKSARKVFFYYTGSQPSRCANKNWKLYYTMVPDTATGGLYGDHLPLTQIANISVIPSSRRSAPMRKSLLGMRFARSPSHRLPLRLDICRSASCSGKRS